MTLRVIIPDSPVESDLGRRDLDGQIVSVEFLDAPDEVQHMRITSTEFPGDGSLVIELEPSHG